MWEMTVFIVPGLSWWIDGVWAVSKSLSRWANENAGLRILKERKGAQALATCVGRSHMTSRDESLMPCKSH